MSVEIVDLFRYFRRLYSYIFLCIMYCAVFMPFVATDDVSFAFRAFELFYNIFIIVLMKKQS